MLANFDYPHGAPDFAAALTREVTAFLDRTQGAPSLAILCGGSEVWQQAAMLGAPRAIWADAFCETTLPALVAARRPDIVVVPNSPSGGALPFAPRGGCTHYFGVGAYCRPLDDARRAEIGFASECLAFANPPEPGTPGPAGPTDPAWMAGIPRDRGADWDFETVRDHYVGHLYGVDPAALRAENPERYLDLGRAAAQVMARRAGLESGFLRTAEDIASVVKAVGALAVEMDAVGYLVGGKPPELGDRLKGATGAAVGASVDFVAHTAADAAKFGASHALALLAEPLAIVGVCAFVAWRVLR